MSKTFGSSYFLCATSPNNLGDLVINQALVRELSKHGTLYLDTYNVPAHFAKELYLTDRICNIYQKHRLSLKNRTALSTILFMKRRGVKRFFMSPGPMNAPINLISLIILLELLLLKCIGVKVYRIGNDIATGLDNRIVRSAYNVVTTHYYIRSHRAVERLNLTGTHSASYIPDLSLLFGQNTIYEKQRSVAVTFRAEAGNREQFKQHCIEQIKRIIEYGYEIHLFHQVDKDEAFIKELSQDLEGYPIIYHPNKIWINDLNFYDDKEFVFSNRLHALLLGAIKGAIPLGYIEKSSKLLTKVEEVFDSIWKNQPNRYIYYYGDRIPISRYNLANEQREIINTIVTNREEIMSTIKNIFA